MEAYRRVEKEQLKILKEGKIPEKLKVEVFGTCEYCKCEVSCKVYEVDARHTTAPCPTYGCNTTIKLHLPTLTREPLIRKVPEPEVRFTKGTSTMDGQKCEAWFNVTNWP